MRTYTVHLRPDRAPVLVREGFSWGALLLGPLWLLLRRAWIAAVLVIAALIALHRVPMPYAGIVMLGVAWLLGLVGQDLRRWGLARRGYTLSHVVAAGGRDAAMLRVLDGRLHTAVGLP